jgi:hypothetical protein
MSKHDKVVTFTYEVTSSDGSVLRQQFEVSPKGKLKNTVPVRLRQLMPQEITKGSLDVGYLSGRQFSMEIDAPTHRDMQGTRHFDSLLNKIVDGAAPGAALSHLLTKMYGLAPIPKLKRSGH